LKIKMPEEMLKAAMRPLLADTRVSIADLKAVKLASRVMLEAAVVWLIREWPTLPIEDDLDDIAEARGVSVNVSMTGVVDDILRAMFVSQENSVVEIVKRDLSGSVLTEDEALEIWKSVNARVKR
jgi:hypothetical protein